MDLASLNLDFQQVSVLHKLFSLILKLLT
jgi:hypothetical protein